MLHITQNSRKKFNLVQETNQEFEFGTVRQDYERREGIYKMLRGFMKQQGIEKLKIQDDPARIVYELYQKGGPVYLSEKPKRNYQPKKKTK